LRFTESNLSSVASFASSGTATVGLGALEPVASGGGDSDVAGTAVLVVVGVVDDSSALLAFDDVVVLLVVDVDDVALLSLASNDVAVNGETANQKTNDYAQRIIVEYTMTS
jgi:hypothetical protein